MRYDFDQVIDRSGNLSAKYDERIKKFGTDDVIPLWIADMDFKTAQPIIDALKARAQEGIWGYTARPDSYFEAVRDWQRRRNGWAPDTGLMSFSLGVVQTLGAMVRLYTPQGGSVLIQTPVYGEFYDMTELAGRQVILLRFKLTSIKYQPALLIYQWNEATCFHIFYTCFHIRQSGIPQKYKCCPGFLFDLHKYRRFLCKFVVQKQ